MQSKTMATFIRDYSSKPDITARYEPLPLPDDAVQMTYVWIDGCNGVRHKSKTIDFVPQTAREVPVWAFGIDWFYNSKLPIGSEVSMLPVALYKDPFNDGNARIALCQAVLYETGEPMEANTRHSCVAIINTAIEHEPHFIVEQAYALFDGNDPLRPLGWPSGLSTPDPNGSYYCGVGANRVFGRDVAEAHYRACMYAGVNISGESAGSKISQWKFEIGPNEGVSIADDLWMARYILQRISEDFNIVVNFDPQLCPRGSDGSQVNISTKAMRTTGVAEVEAAISRLQASRANHKYEFSGYPLDVARRMAKDPTTETPIPKIVNRDGDLYLQDRRPPSNMDPYVVCEQLVRTICLGE